MLEKRVALVEAKKSLGKALERLEDLLTELEHKQGRLPFAEDQPAAEPTRPARRESGNGKRRQAASARA